MLIVLLCPYLGTKAILLFRRMEVREAVKERLLAGVSPSELVQLTFSLKTIGTELEWEHSKEFEYKGEMYDVVKSAPTATDSITYWCIHDKAETKVKRQLDQLTALETGNDPQHRNALGFFLDFLKSLFYDAQEEVEPPAVALIENHFSYLFFTGIIYPPTDSPPPDFPVFHA